MHVCGTNGAERTPKYPLVLQKVIHYNITLLPKKLLFALVTFMASNALHLHYFFSPGVACF